MQDVWTDIVREISGPDWYWQLLVLGIGMVVAWTLNKVMHLQVMHRAPDSWRVGIGGVKRVLFPLIFLMVVGSGKLLLQHWQSTSLLDLATTLLMAMAGIRLSVYALRYIFMPSTWLRTAESAIASVIWVIVALHLAGILPDIAQSLDDIGFNAGKTRISLLLVLQAVVTAVATLIVALWLSRLLENRLMRTEQINMNLRVVLTKLIRFLLILVGTLTALSAVGFDITLLSVFGGALGVGLGFGLQKIASNYVSGFIILLDESVHLGDVITIDGHYGIVSQIRSRYLVLRKMDGTEVVIPNENLISSSMISHSYTDRKVRVLMPVQVSYEGSLELAMECMRQAASRHRRVIQDPSPEVLIKGFGDNGIDLQLSIWIADPEEGTASLQSAIYLEIWHEFQINKISIPYPQRDVRIVGHPQVSIQQS